MTYGFPFPMPNGWFQVGYSEDLPPGSVRPLHYFERELVLFRTASGEPALLDAFCPHLGAHLGEGGRVEGESLRCPFHAWEFDARGACTRVPYASRIPAKARVGAWPLRERGGILWAFHHAEGAAPTWEVPAVPEAEDPSWSAYERFEWTIRTTPQEIGENGVDRAHFKFVHGTPTVPQSEAAFEGHVRRAAQHVTYTTPRGPVEGTISVENHGLGFTLTRFTGLAETVLVLSHTPIDRERVHTRFSFTQPKVDGARPRGGVPAGVVREIVRQVQEDIPIWENKVYRAAPVLCDGDGPIGPYRAWARQFYSLPSERVA